jgi:hypothetical protein
MSDHPQGNNEKKGMRVMCYVISSASIAICLLLFIWALRPLLFG